MQLLGHCPNVVHSVLVVFVADLDIIVVFFALAPNGDVGSNGYVHAIAIIDVVDPDVDRFATFHYVDVLLVAFLVVGVHLATLLLC